MVSRSFIEGAGGVWPGNPTKVETHRLRNISPGRAFLPSAFETDIRHNRASLRHGRTPDTAASFASAALRPTRRAAEQAGFSLKGVVMNNIIWIVGAVVIILFVLGYFGLR